MILEDLAKVSSSVMRAIESSKSESRNVSLSGAIPPSDVLKSLTQPDQFDMLDNPIVPDDMAPMLTTSEALAGLPDFDTYDAMP
jgi:hypothetical protein